MYCCQHSEARPRSERWRLGAREDWRYADLRAAHPRDWWWLSFFAVYLIQARLLRVCLAGAGRPSPAALHHWCAAAWNCEDLQVMACNVVKYHMVSVHVSRASCLGNRVNGGAAAASKTTAARLPRASLGIEVHIPY